MLATVDPKPVLTVVERSGTVDRVARSPGDFDARDIVKKIAKEASVVGGVVEERSYIVVKGVDFLQIYVIGFTLHPVVPAANEVPLVGGPVDGDIRCGGQDMDTVSEI